MMICRFDMINLCHQAGFLAVRLGRSIRCVLCDPVKLILSGILTKLINLPTVDATSKSIPVICLGIGNNHDC
jgi:hypothetical protein